MPVDWKDKIRKNKPKLGDSSIKTYSCTLNSLSRELEVGDNADYYDNHATAVMKHVGKQAIVRKKNLLTALLAVAGSKKAKAIYSSALMPVADELKSDESKQEKSQREQKQWKTQQELGEIYHDLELEAQPLMKKSKPTPDDMRKIMKYVFASCLVLIEPRRIQDFQYFKLKNIDKQTDNYLDGRTMVFNKFKTASKYGKQTITIPEKLRGIVQRWAKINPTGWLLFDRSGKQLSSQQCTKMLKSIFGTSVGVLRHIYISEIVLPDVPALEKLQETARRMAHSTDQQMRYKKVD